MDQLKIHLFGIAVFLVAIGPFLLILGNSLGAYLAAGVVAELAILGVFAWQDRSGS